MREALHERAPKLAVLCLDWAHIQGDDPAARESYNPIALATGATEWPFTPMGS